jgi:diaminopimelate epimerase
MKFVKMQGAGNDYVYVNCFEEQIADRPALARFVSDRHFGVGGDGLICICPSDIADFKMDMYNADGSSAAMCGNGIRCVGKYVYDRGMTDKTTITVESGGAVKKLWLNVRDGKVDTVKVDMGSPELRPEKIPVDLPVERVVEVPVSIGGERWFISCVSMGNPHAVVFVDDVESLKLESIGPEFEHNKIFPERTNTEFVQIIDENTLRMRVWERGSGETLACGTGACASLVAATLTGRCSGSARVLLRGGELFIEWDRENNKIYMTGPAVAVFEGELYI